MAVLNSAFPWSGSEIFCGTLFFIGLCLVWSTVCRRDCWPFSHYPMFGGAMDSTSVRFFRMRILLTDGSRICFNGSTDVVIDQLHREFGQQWRNGAIPRAEADEIVVRYWREACSLDPAFSAAVCLEVTLRIAQLLPGDRIAVMEKTIHQVSLVGQKEES